MTAPEVKITPQAPAVYGSVTSQLSDLQAAMQPPPQAGIDPGMHAGADEHYTDTHQTFNGSTDLSQTTRNAATGLQDEDKAGGDKARSVDDKLNDPTGKAGKGVARLTPADLAKIMSAPQYQSPMPMAQTAPAMPSTPSSPIAPTQSMLGQAGNLAPLINELLSRGEANGTGDGGPKSLLMGATLPGDSGRVQQLASRVLGVPYAWGGGNNSGPTQGTSDGGGPADAAGDYNRVGYDCSGLAKFMTAQLYGVDLPHSSESQYGMGQAVDAANARPGDLVFPGSAGRPPGHVQVYLGNGQVIEAPSSGQTVKISPLQSGSEFRTFHA